MTISLPRCPDCGGSTRLLGPIPAADAFAGRALERPLAGGFLYRCVQCSLGFRWPRLSKAELDVLYSQGSETAWSAQARSRPDWRIARSWIQAMVPLGGLILDVGCFEGSFLQPLVGAYRCSGIEIHPVACNRAREKGIEIIGNDFSSVRGHFDCITAFDVIEHVARPKSLLVNCLAALKPGGWLLFSSGNLDSSTFRWMGSRYWYCAIAEHLSFVSPSWFSRLGDELGFRIMNYAVFAHHDASWLTRIREAASNVLYRTMPAAFHALRSSGVGRRNAKSFPELAEYPPSWISARDHFIVLLQKHD